MNIKKIAAAIQKSFGLLLFHFLFLSLTCDVVLSQSLKGKIKLEVSADTTVFVWGENIWLYLTVQNLLNEGLSVPDPDQGLSFVALQLTDEQGNKLYRGIIPHVVGTWYVTLPPKGKIVEPYNLDGYVNDHEAPGSKLRPGAYKAIASLRDVFSNEFIFRITSPTAEQRLIAKEIVDKLQRWESLTQAIQDGKGLLRQYQNTVYLPVIYLELLPKLAMSDNPIERTDELMKYSLEFAVRYPEKPVVITAISHYIQSWRNKLGVGRDQKLSPQQWRIIEDELQKIKTRFPSERLKRYVEKMIKYNKPK